jgi:argininosuccinate synthase
LKTRILLAHTGAAETTRGISWLGQTRRADVVTLTLDVGQGYRLDDVHDRALAAGAVRAHVIDARETFAREVMLPALREAADGMGPLRLDLRALTHVIVARELAEVAGIEDVATFAYGGRWPTEAHPLTRLLEPLAPAVRRVALARPAPSARSIEASLAGRRVEIAESAAADVAIEDFFVLTKRPSETPDVAACVDLGFERGLPVTINGVPMATVELIQSLETIAGAHGIGRRVTTDASGTLVLEEAPAAIALHAALRALPGADEGLVQLTFSKGDCRVADPRVAHPHLAVTR